MGKIRVEIESFMSNASLLTDLREKYAIVTELPPAVEKVELPLCNIPSQIEINRDWIRDNPTANIEMAQAKINSILMYLAQEKGLKGE